MLVPVCPAPSFAASTMLVVAVLMLMVSVRTPALNAPVVVGVIVIVPDVPVPDKLTVPVKLVTVLLLKFCAVMVMLKGEFSVFGDEMVPKAK